jgi:hypothetical protein
MNRSDDGEKKEADKQPVRYEVGARPRPRLVGSVAVVLVAVACLLVLAPLAQGSGPRALTTWTAPYHGFPHVANTVSMYGCGSTASNWKPAAFSTATGVAVLGEKSHAVACGSPASYSIGFATGLAGLFSKGFTATSGAHHVVVHWKAVWGTKLVAIPGKGAVYASEFVAAYASIYDATNGTSFHQANNWSASKFTTSGNVTFNGTKAVTLYVNATLVAGHSYYIITYVYGTTYAYASGTATGGSADANLNKATFGNSGKLTSVTIS